MKVLVDKVGMNLSQKEIDDLVSNLDKNSDGTITFDGNNKKSSDFNNERLP